MVLGLTLSISQAGIFGAGLTVNAASEAAEDTEESTDTETQTDEEKTPGDEDKKNRGLRKKEINKASPGKARWRASGKAGRRASPGNPGGQSSGVDSYSAVKDYTEDAESEKETFASTGKDENSVHISEGAKVVLDEAEISRKSEESTGETIPAFMELELRFWIQRSQQRRTLPEEFMWQAEELSMPGIWI